MRGTREQTMYDELVKRMRKCATEAGACKTCELDSNPSCTDVLMKQAADAIEGLQGRAKVLEKVSDKWCEAVPRWIPVTERLPDAGRYLALTTPSINSGEPFARILRFSENLESVDRYDFEGINRSGWYYYDDEYGNIEVVTVTHWMPLPEPPKEET